jgi:hypothetical protein
MNLLDQLLADAAAEVAARRGKPKAAKAAADLAAEREAQFVPHALVAMFHQTTCHHCGSIALEFEGIFEERRHIRTGDLHDVRQPFVPLDSELPRFRKYLPRDVPYCEACVDIDSYKE